MKLSTNSRYGLRAMVDLAANYRGAPVPLCVIADRQCVSESYLEQTFAILRKSGLVLSAKGAQGGYALASDPARVTAGMVLRALEGNLSIVDETPAHADPIKQCIRRNVWDAIDARIGQVADSVTLADLALEYGRMRGDAHVDNG